MSIFRELVARGAQPFLSLGASAAAVVARACGVLALFPILQLAGCGGTAGPAVAPTQSSELSPLAALGEKIFSDPSLSASGQQACSTCHEPNQGYAQPTASGVPMGGPNLDRPGVRNAPSLKYLKFTPSFFFDTDGTPTGGFDRDGRAKDLAEQAIRPFLTDFEMGNASAADVATKLAHASYAAEFRTQFGDQIFNDSDAAFAAARQALSAYEREDTDFAPFTSKYDYFLSGQAQLTAAEQRGFALFNDPAKGNCAACHPSARGPDGSHPMFTDFTYDNLGVPRNTAIAANNDPRYFDLGICGPYRTDVASHTELCGAFKVPTLRNIALTAPYFHNGRFQTLEDALGFYVRRDTSPEEWYPIGSDGVVRKFDDLPSEYHKNVNTEEGPYNRHPGQLPALSAAEIQDVIAFLDTLTDGYQP